MVGLGEGRADWLLQLSEVAVISLRNLRPGTASRAVRVEQPELVLGRRIGPHGHSAPGIQSTGAVGWVRPIDLLVEKRRRLGDRTECDGVVRP